ncbi:hypothetical protein [Leptospira alstonii]|uniref:Tetratricopeptide repeat protein n=2 Tax=Leptospira alstonii TaxID=28452 RepID=M6CZ07_9LEPT|nr:hypothetical protein [Leptospira alstonii]EMJ95741.1 hypothetical protein LEP1GSC194_3099 [Leptospira alstonii serovar Sichuan str. 79601]EQA80756.1 hypothetical protein LEP1GSC193_3802 [Leptospira alstonii serovar Pingchang str. 80-412]
MNNIIKISSLYALIFFNFCSIPRGKVYFFPPTKEGGTLKKLFPVTLEYRSINVVIYTKEADGKSLYSGLVQDNGDYVHSEKCDLDDNDCISIALEHDQDCKLRQGYITVVGKFTFQPKNSLRSTLHSFNFSKIITVRFDNCQLGLHEIRVANSAVIESIRRTTMPQSYMYDLPGFLDRYFYFKSDNSQLQKLYNDLSNEKYNDVSQISHAQKILEKAESQFPNDAWLIRNIGTMILFQGDWQKACGYYRRSKMLGYTVRIEEWIYACDQFDFSSVIHVL